MDSVTSLRLKIDSTDVTKAQKELDGLTNASGRAEKGANATASSFSMLGKVLTAGAVIGVTAQYIKLADTMTGMTSKLKLVTTSTSELATAQEELFKIAQKTRQGYAETVDTYSNFAVAMGEMGKSQKEILRVTETVNKAIAISGGTAQQAAAATMQLGQAFASGTLRGDELNSILENSKGLAKAIADGMGVPIGKLRSLGSEGKITAEILANALEKSAASVDEKFGKVGVTVSASVTTMENSMLRLVGTADQAMNGSGGIAEVFTYFAKSMDDNNEIIIESGKDAFRALQVMGVGMIQLGTSFYQAGVAIPTAIALAIDAVTQLMENGINDMIELAEEGTNKAKSLYGGKRVNLGRVDIDTNLSKELLAHYNSIVDTQENAIATQGKLFKDIMGNTTELKKIAPPSDKGSGKGGGAGAELTKEQIAALKNAQKLAEEEAKIQRGYLESYAEIQANNALEEYNVKLGYEEAYRDFAAQEAIAQYEMELGHIEDLAARQAQSAIAFYEMTRTEKDKINEDNLALYEANAGLFNDEQMQTFFTKWQESIEGVKGGYNEIEGIVSSFVEDSLNSKDWTAGLTGTNKALANMGNAFKDIQKQTAKYDVAVKKVNTSQLTSAEKTIELKKLEEAQIGAQIGAYANLANSMAGFYEEGSKEAEAMTVVSATLGIAQGIQAIISAWGSAPFPANMPAVAATTAAVLPMIGQLTGMGGSGGGSVSASTGSGYGSLSKAEMIEAEYSPLTDRLDKQIELLDSIDKNGSSQLLNIKKSAIDFDMSMRLLIEESIKSVKNGGYFRKNATIKEVGKDSLRNMDTFLEFVSGIGKTSELLAGKSFYQKEISFNRMITSVQGAISDFVLGVSDSVKELSSAKDTFKSLFDDITGTTTYATLDLASALNDVKSIMLVGENLPAYLQRQISAIEQIESTLTDSIYNILNSTDPADFEEQTRLVKELGLQAGIVFENGAQDALNYLDSIERVSEAMATSSRNMQSFITSLMTPTQNVDFLASQMGETVATTVEGVSELYKRLATDMDGFTDADLNLVNANLDLIISNAELAASTSGVSDANTSAIEAQKEASEAYLKTITDGLSALRSTSDGFKSTIDKLRNSSLTSTQSLDKYLASMAKTKSLLGGDAIAFSESAKETMGLSSVLSDTSLYSSMEEMAFAQLSAANEFEALDANTVTQIDYLAKIEENTRNQVDMLSKQIESLNQTNTVSNVINQGVLDLVKDISQTEITGTFVPPVVDQEATTPTISRIAGMISNVGGFGKELTFKEAAITGITKAEFNAVKGINKSLGLGAVINPSDIEALIAELNLKGYASGGYTGDMAVNSIAGFVHGKEFVANAPTTKNLGLNKDNGGVFVQMANELTAMRLELSAIKQMQVTQTSTQVKTLSTQNAILANVAS